MHKRILVIIGMLIGCCSLIAQTYISDSLKIEIGSIKEFEVKRYEDLNIKVTYTSTSNKELAVYNKWSSYYKSTFGNCYFELFKRDEMEKETKNITFKVLGNKHFSPELTDEEVLKFDPEKAILEKGGSRTIVFNLLDEIADIAKGYYLLKIYIRAGNNLGYNKNGVLRTNSITYLESEMIEFKVTEVVSRPSLKLP